MSLTARLLIWVTPGAMTERGNSAGGAGWRGKISSSVWNTLTVVYLWDSRRQCL